ncbi:unnamed protein product [Orchesella dallaii]|uniref:Uncharacterized protein n=1 Tax=Orchesella dallaii TaxID=48710 RepID=A0ABP1RQG7_9HEXA
MAHLGQGPNINQGEGADGHQHMNNGGGGGRRAQNSFGGRVIRHRNWITSTVDWLLSFADLYVVKTYTIVLFQMTLLVLIGILLGLMIGINKYSRPQPKMTHIGFSVMSMLNHPHGSLYLGMYDRERAMSTPPSPPSKYYFYSTLGPIIKTNILFENDGKAGSWADCKDKNIKVLVAGVNCNATSIIAVVWNNGTSKRKVLSPGEPCRSNRQLMRGIICSYNAFRYAKGIKLWLLVDDNAPNEEMEKAVQALRDNLIQEGRRRQ